MTEPDFGSLDLDNSFSYRYWLILKYKKAPLELLSSSGAVYVVKDLLAHATSHSEWNSGKKLMWMWK